jgi:hypothetical protein
MTTLHTSDTVTEAVLLAALAGLTQQAIAELDEDSLQSLRQALTSVSALLLELQRLCGVETLGCICCGGVHPQVDCPRRLWTSPNLHMESLLVNRPAQEGNPHATDCPPHSPRRVARVRGSFRSQRCYQVTEQWEEHTRTSWFLPELDTTDQNRQSDTRRGGRRL